MMHQTQSLLSCQYRDSASMFRTCEIDRNPRRHIVIFYGVISLPKDNEDIIDALSFLGMCISSL